MHYVGTFANNGEVFDSSRGKEPIEFTVGVGQAHSLRADDASPPTRQYFEATTSDNRALPH